MKEVDVKIGGMHCVMCANAVCRAVKKTNGVSGADVSYASESAHIVYDENKTDIKNIAKAVKKAGYSVIEDESKYKKRAFKILMASFVFSAVLTLPFLISMILMLAAPQSAAFMLLHDARLQFVLATLVEFGVGWRFFRGAFDSIRGKSANMDVLVSLGTLSAYIYSTYNLFSGGKTFYFEACAMVITLVFLGKIFEAKAKSRADSAVDSLLRLQPKRATVIKDGVEVSVSTKDIRPGDTVLVRPGEGVAVDGVIAGGCSAIDESMLTGESIPVTKGEGDSVFAGTVNRQGAFTFRATETGSGTMLSSIVKMVRTAQQSKPPIQDLVDKVANVFVPAILGIAAVTFIAVMLTSHNMPTAVSRAVAVLVVACPCSLGLATPTALMVGTGMAASGGILIKDAGALQYASKINTVILDKTGTVTKGEPQVTDFKVLSGDESELLRLAAATESLSEHPVGRAVYSFAAEKSASVPPTENFTAKTGSGVTANAEGKSVYIGKLQNETASEFERDGKTAVVMTVDGVPSAVFAAADAIKEDSAEAVQKLVSSGVNVVMVTGDNETTARAVAEKAGIKEVVAGVLPGGKQEQIERFKKSGGVVAMVGDGANDAPALAAADIGMALGTGTDVAANAGSMVLMSGSLSDVPKAINLSKAIMRKIKQNLFWAFIYNSLGVPLAAFGILNPIIAGACMAFSSVSVVSNSLLLKRAKI